MAAQPAISKEPNRLSAASVKSARVTVHDGRGLYLLVRGQEGDRKKPPTKSWLLRYKFQGRERGMGLGPFPEIGLAAARDLAEAARTVLKLGRDPLAERQAAREAEQAAAAKAAADATTFKQAAQLYIKAHRPEWQNAAHAKQWESTLQSYAYPVIGGLAVGEVNTGHITKILQPLWDVKTETASRLRGRIEAILDYGATMGWRDENLKNPATWHGHLENLFAKRCKVAPVVHHPALDWRQLGTFMAELRKQDSGAALALQFCILTAARTGEVIGAQWSEIDLKSKTWIVPGTRMKARREHRVPLSDAACDVLRAAGTSEGAVFRYRGSRLSNMALLSVLKRMQRADLTTHGFRSTFRDWCAEATAFARELAEAALAHTLDKTEGAYQRGDLLERRRAMMDAWAQFCDRPYEDNVVTLRAAS